MQHRDDSLAEGLNRAALDGLVATGLSLAESLYRLIGELIGSSYPPGSRLPSIRAMATQSMVGPETVVRAYDKLVQDGRVEAVRGSGFFVRRAETWQVARGEGLTIPGFPHWQSLIENTIPLDRRPGTGVIHPDILSVGTLVRSARTSLQTRTDLLTDPGASDGYAPLRQQIQRLLAMDSIVCSESSILTGAGATAVMNVVVRALVRPEQYVLVEDPGPFIHEALLMSQGAFLERVPREADGPDVVALRAACERFRPKLFFCASVLHNPSGGSIAPHKAFQILRLAEEFDMTIVDDASYSGLHPGGARAPTALAALGGLDNVIHVGSFSRTGAVGLQLGYLVAGAGLMEWFRLYRAVQSLSGPIVSERTVYQWLIDGKFRRTCALLASRVADCRKRLIADLCHVGFQINDTGAGPFVWLSLGDNVEADAVATDMQQAGYVTTRPGHFSHAPQYRSFMRLNATTTTPAAVRLLSEFSHK